jgi:hypothetical protein
VEVAALTRLVTFVDVHEKVFDVHRVSVSARHEAELAATLRQQGVVVDARELRRLPHDVVLSRALLARLGEEAGEGQGRRDEGDR